MLRRASRPFSQAINHQVPLNRTQRFPPAFASPALFRQNLQENNIAPAVAQYKALHAVDKIHELSYQDHAELLDHLTVHKNPLQACETASIIVKNMLNSQFELKRQVHHSVLTIYLRANNYLLFMSHFDSMPLYFGYKPDLRCFNLLLCLHSQRGDHQGLLKTWKQLLNIYPLSKYTNLDGWAFVLESYGGQKDIETVQSIYLALQGNNCVGSVIYEAFMRACGDCDRLDLVEQAFEKLPIGEENDWLGYYDAVIEACIENNNDVKLEKYWNEFLDFCDTVNLKNGLQKLARKKGEWNPDFKLRHKERYFTPWPITIQRLMTYYNTLENYSRTSQLFTFLDPSSRFTASIHELAAEAYWHQSEFDIAQKVVHIMRLRGLQPNESLFMKVKAYRHSRVRNKLHMPGKKSS